MAIDIGFNGTEESRLEDAINAVNPKQQTIIKYVDFDYADAFVRKEISENEQIKAIINAQKFDLMPDNKETFRKKLAFHSDTIKTIILKAGLGICKVSGDKTKLYTPQEVSDILASDYVGYGILQQAIEDDEVTDIYVNTYDNIWIYKNGKNIPYEHHFKTEKHYENWLEMILRKTGKKTNSGENKITDAEYFGNRLNVLNKTICPKGTALSLRKHYEDPVTQEKLIEQNVIDKDLAEFISVIIASERSFVMGGITGSGKSTTLRALLNANLPYQNKRVIVVEDTQELFLNVPNSVEAITFEGNAKTTVTQTDLIIASLRMRPRVIVIGEVRGNEIYAAVQAAATGHMLITSCHGETAYEIIDRLVMGYQQVMPNMTDAMVEKVVASSIKFIMIQDDDPLSGRKISTIDQIVIDRNIGRCKLVPIARYNITYKDWDYFNLITDETQYNMLRRGIPQDRLEALNTLMKERIEITKQRGVTAW